MVSPMTRNGNADSGRAPSELIGDQVRIFRRGSIWYANFQLNGRQQRRSLRTRSRKEARRRAVQLEADLQNGDTKAVRRPLSIQKVIEAYTAQLHADRCAPKTLRKYAYAFRLVLDLAERRMARTIRDLNLTFVDAFRAERAAGGASPKTVHTDTVIIRQIVNFAVRRGWVSSDPLQGFRLKRPKPTPQPYWTPEQVDRILENKLHQVACCTIDRCSSR